MTSPTPTPTPTSTAHQLRLIELAGLDLTRALAESDWELVKEARGRLRTVYQAIQDTEPHPVTPTSTRPERGASR